MGPNSRTQRLVPDADNQDVLRTRRLDDRLSREQLNGPVRLSKVGGEALSERQRRLGGVRLSDMQSVSTEIKTIKRQRRVDVVL